MRKDALRKILAIIIVGTWGGGMAMILILILLNLIDIEKGQEILKTFSSVNSGFVGMLLGYYFSGNPEKNS